MIRLFGFIVGAGLAVAAILLVLGVPEIAPQPVPHESPTEPAAPRTQEVVEPPPAPAPEPIVTAAEPPEPEPEPVTAPPDPVPVEQFWHSFWSPFGSQIAANGFVGRLEAVTGYDYRVVKIETGVYEVTFAYTSDEERRIKLETIAAATGLEIPGT